MNEALVVLVRGIIGFSTLLIFARILGKQQISQLTFFDYVLGITIGSTASTLTTDLSSSAWPHWVGVMTWVVAVLIIQYITMKSRTAAHYINDEPTIVIMNGKLMESSMKRMRYTIAELLEQLRLKDIFDISQVEYAIVETNGQLSVLKKSEFQPVTPKDMNIPSQYQGLSTEIIFDGTVIDHNLKKCNHDRTWLMDELKKQGINDIKEVFWAQLNSTGQLYVDKYVDGVTERTNISE